MKRTMKTKELVDCGTAPSYVAELLTAYYCDVPMRKMTFSKDTTKLVQPQLKLIAIR